VRSGALEPRSGFGQTPITQANWLVAWVRACEAHWARVAEPWVFRYWFEYSGGTALWANDDATRAEFSGGVSWVAPERLPLSREVVARIHELQEWFDRSLNWDYPPDPGPWRQDECDRFNRAARELYDAITRELGSTFVVSYDQALLSEDPDLDIYLKDKRAYRRRQGS
jgi:hypothetical protein